MELCHYAWKHWQTEKTRGSSYVKEGAKDLSEAEQAELWGQGGGWGAHGEVVGAGHVCSRGSRAASDMGPLTLGCES